MVACEVERAAIVSFSCKLIAVCEEPCPDVAGPHEVVRG
jgi:hypothetical protein